MVSTSARKPWSGNLASTPKLGSTCRRRHATWRGKSHAQALARTAQLAYTHAARNTTHICAYAPTILGVACCCFEAQALLPEITWAWVHLLSGAASAARVSLRPLHTSHHAEGAQKGPLRVLPGSSSGSMHVHHIRSQPAILDSSTPCPRGEDGVCVCGSGLRRCYCHFHAWQASQCRSPTLQNTRPSPPFSPLPKQGVRFHRSGKSATAYHQLHLMPAGTSTCCAHQARSSAMLHRMIWHGGSRFATQTRQGQQCSAAQN